MTSPLDSLEIGESVSVRVGVTQDDIDRGQPEDCWKCPLTLALRRMFPDYVPEVDTTEILLNKEDPDDLSLRPVFRAEVTPEIEEFINAVDRYDDEAGPQDFMMTFTRTGW